jgi:hypothetical protein
LILHTCAGYTKGKQSSENTTRRRRRRRRWKRRRRRGEKGDVKLCVQNQPAQSVARKSCCT